MAFALPEITHALTTSFIVATSGAILSVFCCFRLLNNVRTDLRDQEDGKAFLWMHVRRISHSVIPSLLLTIQSPVFSSSFRYLSSAIPCMLGLCGQRCPSRSSLSFGPSKHSYSVSSFVSPKAFLCLVREFILIPVIWVLTFDYSGVLVFILGFGLPLLGTICYFHTVEYICRFDYKVLSSGV